MKKRVLMNKEADENLTRQIVFILLVLIFIVGIVLIITTKRVSVNEQIYSKQIALAIDKAKPGTTISIDIYELYKIAEKNNFNPDEIVKIDNDKGKVNVKLIAGGGYSYSFFNDANILWMLDKKNSKLSIEVV
jgi:hypothetical protein